MNPIVQFKHYTCRLVIDRYVHGGFPSLRLIDAQDGSPIATATINLIDYNLAPPLNHCYIKEHSENQGMVEALVNANVVTPVKQIHFGSYQTTATLCQLSPHLVEQLANY